ncbi:hypothetical protein G6L37_01435 [Agrobacterium rubi]|nr:hypothetical protein [Agrobacterium rubi]NTF24055.1 hypothetical protein [Agrobacterium rubi]
MVLASFMDDIDHVIETLEKSGSNQNLKAEVLNSRSNKILADLTSLLPTGDDVFRGRVAVVVSYCHAVASLEGRQRVWPYTMLDLSRRVGELWQATCLVAWTHSVREDVAELAVPEFADVRDRFLSDVWDLFHDHPNVVAGIDMIDEFTGRLNRITMASDKIFTVAGVPHVIDFKFRFRSNEKGNKNRVEELGWAYRKWDPRTDLGILVCHTENNNYLEMLDKESAWNVLTGRDAYSRIEELTGFPLAALLDDCVDFRSDLSRGFVDYLQNSEKDLTCFIDWSTRA